MSTNITISFKNAGCESYDEALVFFEANRWNAESKKDLIESINKVIQCLDNNLDTLKVEFAVTSNESYSIIKKLNTQLKGANHVINTKLSHREIDVLEQILKGKTNTEIAAALFISIDTVKTHRKRILSKTGVSNTHALINYYHTTLFDN